jgi:hypothetical protein
VGKVPDKGAMMTDASGFGGLINVKAPKATASAFHGSSAAFGKQTVHVRPQTFTFVYLGPTPS